MQIKLNGKTKELTQSLNIAELVTSLGYKPEVVVAEVNEKILKKTDWVNIQLKENDVVEIVSFVGGG